MVSSSALLGLFRGRFLGLALRLKASADLFTPALSLLECIRKKGLTLTQCITQIQSTEVLTKLKVIQKACIYKYIYTYIYISIKMESILTFDLVQLQGY